MNYTHAMRNLIAEEVSNALSNEPAHGRVMVDLPSLERERWPPESNQLTGELFLVRRRFGGLSDDSLTRMLGVARKALATSAALPVGVVRAELRQNGPIFDERDADLRLRILPATLVVEVDRAAVEAGR